MVHVYTTFTSDSALSLFFHHQPSFFPLSYFSIFFPFLPVFQFLWFGVAWFSLNCFWVETVTEACSSSFDRDYALTSNVDGKAIASHPIPNPTKQTQTKQITLIHFLLFSSRHHLRPPTAATTSHLPPNSSPHVRLLRVRPPCTAVPRPVSYTHLTLPTSGRV